MYTVLVSARFKSADPAVNKKAHDDIASATQKLAMSRGDLAHKVLLAAEDPRGFLAIDVWKSLAGMQEHFSDPRFVEGVNTVFEGPPVLRVYRAMPGASTWGELAPAPGSLLVTVEATFAQASDEENLRAHNQVAEAGREAAQKLGDVAHLAYLSHEDSRRFLAIDIWKDPEGMKTFFANADVQKGFGSLFTGPPKVTVYAATDYYQW